MQSILEGLPGVLGLQVNVREGTAVVQFQPETAEPQDFAEALIGTAYAVTSVGDVREIRRD